MYVFVCTNNKSNSFNVKCSLLNTQQLILSIIFYQTGYDDFWYHNNMQFSTYEVDNDQYNSVNCATKYGGNAGNWYQACHHQNLNGQYGADGDEGYEFLFWWNFDTSNPRMALKSMRWMIREIVKNN